MWLFNSCEDGTHQFEARYDKGAAEPPLERMKKFSISEGALEALRPVTYVRDVCVRCGATVERQTPPTNTE